MANLVVAVMEPSLSPSSEALLGQADFVRALARSLAPGSLSVWIFGPQGAARTTLEGQAGAALTWDAYLGPEVGLGPEIDPWD